MNEIRVDFAPPSLRRRIASASIFTWLLLVAGLSLSASAAWSINGFVESYEAQATTIARLQTKLSRRTLAVPVVEKITIPEPQAIAVNHAIAQLNLPWRDVLDAIEAATPKTIALLALEPDAKRNLIKGSAEAKSSSEMIAYIEELKHQAFFVSVILNKHEINERDPNKPLRFQFEVQWAEDAK
ncbi:hypothetical protein [Undibacterium terreum]|uniref:Fimbrial assembly protein (PilN) n=1 Tax=Undibacterium terreum TaxID=1224302 RepID=A0A916USU5_9BURK|nr:hypothetical protein [Undibacterium terreum]GGC83335.1 hypothetical protein GCM10011396_33430 [Undibacterium terreum]